MRLKVKRIDDGPGPNEVIIEVTTSEGASEQVVVHKLALDTSGMIEIGSPVQRRQDRFLVELPRESMSGAWRVWVPNEHVA